MREIPLAIVEKIARNNGVDRISADALREIELFVEELGEGIARESGELAKHSKRNTILGKDVRLAAGKV